MLAVLQGLATIGIVVGVGYGLARTTLLPPGTPVLNWGCVDRAGDPV